MFSVFVVATGVFAAQKQTEELRELVLDMNAYAARGQAASVLYELDEYAEVIEQAARDPAVRALAETGRDAADQAPRAADSPCAAESPLVDGAPLEPYARAFDSFFVLSTFGCTRARFPGVSLDVNYNKTSFASREYFRGAERFGNRGEASTFVAQAFRSRLSNEIRFALSTPILDAGCSIGTSPNAFEPRSTSPSHGSAPSCEAANSR